MIEDSYSGLKNNEKVSGSQMTEYIKDYNPSFFCTFIPYKFFFTTEALYMQWAQEDMEGLPPKSKINALSNIKRAVGERIDTLLLDKKIYGIAKKRRWGIPYKLEVLRKFGINAPDTLKTFITDWRNILEHQYGYPPRDSHYIQQAYDIASLFLDVTEPSVQRGTIIFAMSNEKLRKFDVWREGIIVFNDEQERVMMKGKKKLYICDYQDISVDDWILIDIVFKHSKSSSYGGGTGQLQTIRKIFPFTKHALPVSSMACESWQRLIY